MKNPGAQISDHKAKELMAAYEQLLAVIPAGLLEKTLGVTFGKEFLTTFMQAGDCTGIHFSFGLNEHKRLTLVLEAQHDQAAPQVHTLSANAAGGGSGGGSYGNQGNLYP